MVALPPGWTLVSLVASLEGESGNLTRRHLDRVPASSKSKWFGESD